MKPSIGRIVHYHHAADTFPRPALVLYVSPDPFDVLDLRVFEYGVDMQDFFAGDVHQLTPGRPITFPCWSWPPKVPE